jgi:hypothetical protein
MPATPHIPPSAPAPMLMCSAVSAWSMVNIKNLHRKISLSGPILQANAAYAYGSYDRDSMAAFFRAFKKTYRKR